MQKDDGPFFGWHDGKPQEPEDHVSLPRGDLLAVRVDLECGTDSYSSRGTKQESRRCEHVEGETVDELEAVVAAEVVPVRLYPPPLFLG